MRIASVLVLAALAFGGCDLFDGNKTTVSGTIFDRESRQPVPGICVVILGRARRFVRDIEARTTSDAQGRYRLVTHAEGLLDVSANDPIGCGFDNPAWGSGARVETGARNEVNLTVTYVSPDPSNGAR